MPTFDYVCGQCGHVTEVLLASASGTGPAACPACGAETMTRRLSSPHGRVKAGAADAARCCGRDTPCQAPPCADGTCPR